MAKSRYFQADSEPIRKMKPVKKEKYKIKTNEVLSDMEEEEYEEFGFLFDQDDE
jgi:hypothetical protein